MAKLICTLDNKVIAEYSIKAKTTIGRRQDNDIVVDNLAVSGLHAKITIIGRDAFLEDTGSTNGTVVNLKPVKKHILQNDDVIEIGRHQFRFITDDNLQSLSRHSSSLNDTPNTQPPSLKSVIQQSRAHRVDELSDTTPMPIPSASPAQSVAENNGRAQEKNKSAQPLASSAPVQTANPNLEPKLRILNGSNAGKTLPLNKTLTTLGKPGVQVVVITKRNNGFFVSQVEGSQKLKINQQPPKGLSVALVNQDVIDISGIQMQFVIE